MHVVLLPVARDCPTIAAVARRITRPVVLVPLVIVLVLVGAGLWFWFAASRSTPVSAQSALEEYGTAGGETVTGPRAGAWSFAATGSETVGFGPVRVTRDLPAVARLVVRPAAGGYWRTLALSEEHVEATRLVVGAAGTRARSRTTTLTVAGIGRTQDDTMAPPPLVYPSRLAVGDAWRQRYALHNLDVDARVRVLRRDVVRVGDADVPVFVIRTDGVITGAIPGRRVDVDWYAPSLGLPVRWTIDMDVSGAASLVVKADLRMTSIEPLT